MTQYNHTLSDYIDDDRISLALLCFASHSPVVCVVVVQFIVCECSGCGGIMCDAVICLHGACKNSLVIYCVATIYALHNRTV